MRPRLLRRLNAFDLALICVGLVIGSGIFRTPAAVAQRAQAPGLIVACWAGGGVIAIVGAYVFAELAARRPVEGGVYGYLKEAYHPAVGFLFGWSLLLIFGTGANAAAAVLFAGYLQPLTGSHLDTRIVAALTLAVLAGINLLGVRQGGNWQNALGLLKVAAIAAIVVLCLIAHPHAALAASPHSAAPSGNLLAALGVAMLPVLFTYNGFQNATVVTAETIEPARTIPRALLAGIALVVVLYVCVNLGYLRVLGAGGLAASGVPAAAAMLAAVGPSAEKLTAAAIALSVLGYLSTCMLVHPRVYYQMAADGLFFAPVAWISRSTHVPAVAIGLQAVVASVIALSGTYEQIVDWVVLPQWLFMGLAPAIALFVFRKRDAGKPPPFVRVPGHPYTTSLFIAAVAGILASEFVIYPRATFYGLAVLASGAIAFAVRRCFARPARRQITP